MVALILLQPANQNSLKDVSHIFFRPLASPSLKDVYDSMLKLPNQRTGEQVVVKLWASWPSVWPLFSSGLSWNHPWAFFIFHSPEISSLLSENKRKQTVMTFKVVFFNFYQEIIFANVTDISLVLPDERLSSVTRAAFYHPTYSNALLLPTLLQSFPFFDELVFTSCWFSS